MASTELRIYLTHHQMIITNNQGFRFEINIPTPGNMVVVNVSHDAFYIGNTFHIGHHPQQPTRSPNLSDLESDDSRPPSIPPNGGSIQLNPGNPNQN